MENPLTGLFWLGMGADGRVLKKRQEIIIFRNIEGSFSPELLL
jgi:hypothetical protein